MAFNRSATGGPTEYTLDFDFFAENVGLNEVRELVLTFNAQCVDLFHWAIGPRTLKNMQG